MDRIARPDPVFRDLLRQVLGSASVLEDPADCWPYGYDNSREQAPPDLVGFALEPAQVGEVVQLCSRHRVPLVARGRGTGTTGAAVPVRGGLVLSLERMAQALEVNPEDRLMVVQPGITNQAVQDLAGAHGFFWPPDPTSAAYCTVGGNLGHNSAGPRAVKYGTPRENTLGLRAVTGAGEAIRTGVRTTKGVVGYDLTRLLIGSEGTLAVITEATLKLTPLPEAKRALRAVYRDIGAAAAAVARVMAQPVIPSALEYIGGLGVDLVRGSPGVALPAEAGAILLIEVDGPAAWVDEAARAVAETARGAGLVEIAIATRVEDGAEIWAARKALSPALRSLAPRKINEDVAVPVSRLPEFVRGVEQLSARYRLPIVNFGHAGNGNIHTNLMVDPERDDELARAGACLSELFDLVIALNGTLSGEHGVGLAKRAYVDREIDGATLAVMRRIKQDLDPNGILNPGKLFPDGAPPAARP
jgi:D-lactate dehydrogenase